VGVCSCFVPYSIDRVHEGIRAATASSWCLWECLGESGGLVGVFWVSLIWELVLLLFFRGLCKELLKGWSSLDSSCFSIETVSGGITNLCEFLAP
jgi:hypothetical protein